MWKPDIKALLDALGIEAKRAGRTWVAKCPSHVDTNPSWRIIDDGGPKTGSHNCFSCGFSGGPWELVACVRDLTLEEAGEWIWTTLGGGKREAIGVDGVPAVVVRSRMKPREFELPFGTKIPSVDGSEWFAPALEYLRARRVADWQIARWHLGYALTGRLHDRVVAPVHFGGRLVSYVARSWLATADLRYLTPKRDEGALPELALFGEPGIDPAVDEATVCEGVFKHLALERAGAPNPLATLGSQAVTPEKLRVLVKFRRVLLAFDPDHAGRKARDEVRAALARYTETVDLELAVAPDDMPDDELAAAVAR